MGRESLEEPLLPLKSLTHSTTAFEHDGDHDDLETDEASASKEIPPIGTQRQRLSTCILLVSLSSLLLAAALFAVGARSLRSPPSPPPPADRAIDWPSVHHAFAFGDSYTTVHGWKAWKSLPTPSELPIVGDIGITSSRGLTWAQQLAWRYNKTDVQLWTFAEWGATVDEHIISMGVRPLVNQVDHFLQHFCDNATQFWTTDDALFLFWIGTNDAWKDEASYGSDVALFNLDMQELASMWRQLYAAGARRFLVLSAPPFERSPEYGSVSQSRRDHLDSMARTFNDKELEALEAFVAETDAEVVLYDMHTAQNYILDHAEAFGFEVLDHSCDYLDEWPAIPIPGNATTASCTTPFERMFWADTFHPTWRVHEILARDISQQVERAPKGILLVPPGLRAPGPAEAVG